MDVDSVLAGLASRLRKIREGAGLTREQLAERAGLSFGVIRDIESQSRGEQGPGIGTLVKLANALGVGLFDLLALAAPSKLDGLAIIDDDTVRKVRAAKRRSDLDPLVHERDIYCGLRLNSDCRIVSSEEYEEIKNEMLAKIARVNLNDRG